MPLKRRSPLRPLLCLSPLAVAAAGCTPSSPAATPAAVGPGATPASALVPAAPPPPEAVPSLRLPGDTRPLSERLELRVSPDRPGFSGSADIVVQLDRARRILWLHGRKLHVTSARATPDGGAPIEGTWEQKEEHGTAALTLTSELPRGKATLHLEFDAPFAEGRTGLYRVTEGGIPYAFTQFEPLDARGAFPCFDEPGFKIPFSVTLEVPSGSQAIANTPEAARVPGQDGAVRVSFAETKPIPSYLVAFAVGPFDVVAAPDLPANGIRSRPLPFRGVAVKGRGKELAYTLAHGGEFLAALERYFGSEYPYEKLDLIAVPDKNGAMENPGAVTFDEQFLLFDERTAPVRQKQTFAEVVAHELSHQWFGDLVTMKWWDDTWLNESFASWIQGKIADEWNPATQARLETLGGVQGAIGTDSLVSARAIHQPIASLDDIENSFDGITYQKGAGVLGMFERWLGEETFRAGVRLHLSRHPFGSANADDFLAAMSAAAKRDVSAPFHTFLDQPGVPYVEAELRCDGSRPRLHLKQSRFLPLGSTGDANKTWAVPVCARYEVSGKSHESCALLSDREADMPLDGNACPSWVFPNSDAAGYFRFALAPKDLAALRTAGVAKLSARERIAFANSLRAAFNHGTTSFADSLRAASALAADPDPQVASQPAVYLDIAHDWLYADGTRAAIEAAARALYGKELTKLGWAHRMADDPQTIARRELVLGYMADLGRDPATRGEAKRRALAYLGYGKDDALHPEAIDPNLTARVLQIAGEEASPPLFDALVAKLDKTEQEEIRQQLVGAIAAARAPALAARARSLLLEPRIRVTEIPRLLFAQLGDPETREATWAWLKEHWDALLERAKGNMFGGGHTLEAIAVFCDQAHAEDAASFFGERAQKIDGGPRALASALEEVNLCIAKRAAQEADARSYFARTAK